MRKRGKEKKEKKVKIGKILIQLLLADLQLLYSAVCFVSIQVVEFPTTSGGKKYDHLVGSSASGQKSDHLVGNLTTSSCQNKKSKLKRGGLSPAT